MERGQISESRPETVTTLYRAWSGNPDSQAGSTYAGLSPTQVEALFEEYIDLQRRIVDAIPTNAVEVAQQVIAATDNGSSVMPYELIERLRQMAAAA